jgi:putative transcriptional regulator
MDELTERFRIRLGLRIRNIRVEKGLEQGELAAILNKDKQFVNRYEKRGANPSAYILVEIAKAVGVTLNELIDFSKISEVEVEKIYKKQQ